MHRKWGNPLCGLLLAALCWTPVPVWADDLFKPGVTQSLSSDRRATQPGDTISIVVLQAAESSTSLQSGTRRSTALSGQITAGKLNESGQLGLGNSFSGSGEVRRTERFVTQMSATITFVLPNGDLRIEGAQHMLINGESTTVEVRGRIRPTDIDSDNRVASNRIADAQINYNGKGFVSRSGKPGPIQRIFSFLGL
jgi:flagellar L-ring protein precursor FlgH